MRKVKFGAFFKAVAVSLIMFLGIAFVAVGETGERKIAMGEEQATSLKLLGIGDTMTTDALEYIFDASISLGIDDVSIGILWQNNDTSIAEHKNNALNNSKTYNFTRMFSVDEEAQKSTVYGVSINDALKADCWDYVSIQQSRELSGRIDTYDESVLAALCNEIDNTITDSNNENANSEYKLAWLMTWADLENGVLSQYDTQLDMYESIVSCVDERIVLKADDGLFDLIIPAGTAIQNMRTSYAGDSLNSNAYRLNGGLGRYTAAASIIRALIGDIENLSFVPKSENFSAFYIPAIIESANNAALKPLEVTQSQHINTPFDLSKYMQIDCQLEAWGYWNAVSETHYFKRITQENDCMYSIASENRFTKENLPTGAIIEVANGYMYRPEAWTDNSPQPAQDRKANVSARYFVITDDWWDGYEMRAFNITTIISRAQAFETNEGIDEYFKIYIPMSSAKTITRLEAGLRVGKITGNNITVNLPANTDLTAVKVKVYTDGECTINPSTSENWDVSSPVQITVTAKDGSTNVYTLTASLEADASGTPKTPEKSGCGNSKVTDSLLLLTALLPLAFVIKMR